MQLDLIGDVHRLGPHELQQGRGDARVPGGDACLGLHQVPPAALQVGGGGAVQSHVGQTIVQHAVVGRLHLVEHGRGVTGVSRRRCRGA